MREIEFRGKRADNGKWVYGSLINKFDVDALCVSSSYIIERSAFSISADSDTTLYDVACLGDYYEVDEDSVCQFTGLKDKNGVKVYEGDVIRILYTDWASKSENDTRTLDEYLRDIAKIGVVEWDIYYPQFHIHFMDKDNYNSLYYGRYGYIEVIGNIYDNPELIKESE